MITVHISEFYHGRACEEGLLPHRPPYTALTDPTCNGLLEMNLVPSGSVT